MRRPIKRTYAERNIGSRPRQQLQIVRQQRTGKGHVQPDPSRFKLVAGGERRDFKTGLVHRLRLRIIPLRIGLDAPGKPPGHAVDMNQAGKRLTAPGPVASEIVCQTIRHRPNAEIRIDGYQRYCRWTQFRIHRLSASHADIEILSLFLRFLFLHRDASSFVPMLVMDEQCTRLRIPFELRRYGRRCCKTITLSKIKLLCRNGRRT
ncbi:hypothetical protein D3C81_1075590 [compost metagenome]